MNLFSLTTVLGLALETLADFVCEAPQSSNGPLPPVLPESYHIVLEKNDLIRAESSFINIWYDWPNQMVRSDEVFENSRKVAVYNFQRGSFFEYFVPLYGVSDDIDDERDFSCRFMNIGKENGRDIPFYDSTEKPVRMVDVYQALFFGGRYRYKFVQQVADDSSRFIMSNKFASCIKDKLTGRTLNVTYYWTIDANQESQPVKYEIFGGFLNASNGQLSENGKTNDVFSVIKFERDPEIPRETFLLPRHMACAHDSRILKPEGFIRSSENFAWREETLRYTTTTQGEMKSNVVVGYKEVWSSNSLRCARVDWTPHTSEVENTFLKEYANTPISIIADMAYQALFITEKIHGRCRVQPLTEEFPFAKKVNGTFRLKTMMELLDMDGPRVVAGKYSERNIGVLVFTNVVTNDSPSENTILHEATFRFDPQLILNSNDSHYAVPVSELTRTLYKPLKQQSVVQKSYFQVRNEYSPYYLFEAIECIAKHELRIYELRFPGFIWTEINMRRNEFLSKLRFKIFSEGGFDTVMRVQDLNMYLEGNRGVLVTMVLLEPWEEMKSEKAVTVKQAATKISEVVNDGKFLAPFKIKNARVYATRYSFKELNFKGSVHDNSAREVFEKTNAKIDFSYSDGSLIAVCIGAFIVGIAGGFLIMYLRRRKTGMEEPLIDTFGVVELSMTEQCE